VFHRRGPRSDDSRQGHIYDVQVAGDAGSFAPDDGPPVAYTANGSISAPLAEHTDAFFLPHEEGRKRRFRAVVALRQGFH
jgi:hypothetical protein